MLVPGTDLMLMKFFRLLDILQPLIFKCPAEQLFSLLHSTTCVGGHCEGMVRLHNGQQFLPHLHVPITAFLL